jgi:hypothetical protein
VPSTLELMLPWQLSPTVMVAIGLAAALYAPGVAGCAAQLVWLLPPVAFDVMVSNPLYRLMSWCTVLGCLPFWHLILDPRSHPLARLRLRQRFLYADGGLT